MKQDGYGDKRGLGHNASHPVIQFSYVYIAWFNSTNVSRNSILFSCISFLITFPNATKIKFLPAFPQTVRGRVPLQILMTFNFYQVLVEVFLKCLFFPIKCINFPILCLLYL